jgi:hypothetical protein
MKVNVINFFLWFYNMVSKHFSKLGISNLSILSIIDQLYHFIDFSILFMVDPFLLLIFRYNLLFRILMNRSYSKF